MYVSMRNAYMKKLTDANVDMQKDAEYSLD